MNEQIFNSFTLPIPPLRFDLQRITVEQNGQTLIHFYDSLGYTTANFALPIEAEAILSLFDGNRSVNDILAYSSDEVTKEEILSYAQFLDEHRLLDSPYFAEQAEATEQNYEISNIHTPVTAGNSYPEDAHELKTFLDEAFTSNEQTTPVDNAKALFAPHIDPRVGMKSYIKAFSAIKNLKPKRVVILATSHYSGLYGDLYEETPFIISEKTFTLPNGDVKANSENIAQLKRITDKKKLGVSFQDRAFRIEHSVELHLLFLNHIWNHDFSIIPILVGGFDELLYMEGGFRAQQVDEFSRLLNKQFGNDDDTFFLISGDLSHFGKKFGDAKPARELVKSIQEFDHQFVQSAIASNADEMRSLLKRDYDATRICGFPPLLSFLRTMPNLKGTQLSYDLWDEIERESAVSFGSIIYS